MSLGDYEQTYRMVIEATIRSKFRKPPPEEDVPWDIGTLYDSDGVDITTLESTYISTKDLLLPETRAAIEATVQKQEVKVATKEKSDGTS